MTTIICNGHQQKPVHTSEPGIFPQLHYGAKNGLRRHERKPFVGAIVGANIKSMQ
jgi:hypothetical protein